MFIQRLKEAGELQDGSQMAATVQKIASASLQGSEKSLLRAKQAILNRHYRTIGSIRKSSWEELGIQMPELTIEEKCEITGLSLEEYR